MKIGCFVLAKNEAVIINPFMDQLDEFMDHIVLIDHSSTDDTLEKIRSHKVLPKTQIFNLRSAGYPQQQLATFFAYKMFDLGCDYIFFLDCDEFLPFATRMELEKLLKSDANTDIFLMPWLNIIPESLDNGRIFEQNFLTNGTYSPFKKILISKNILKKDPNFKISKGYHSVEVSAEEIKINILQKKIFI